MLVKELGHEIPTSQMQCNAERIKKINVPYTLEEPALDNVEKIKYLGKTITNDLEWNTRRQLIGPLASLDVIWQHVPRMLKSQHTRDWCVQFWGMVVQFGKAKVYFFKMI